MNAIESIRERTRANLFGDKLNTDGAKKLYDALVEGDVPGTFCWPDIKYGDQTHGMGQFWDHYNRIIEVVRGFGEKKLFEDKEYVEKMTGAINYWLEHNFVNPNWWHNEIGAPQGFGNICLMMYPVLDSAVIDHVVEQIMSRGSIATNEKILKKWTGANLIWGARNTIRHALLVNDEELLALAINSFSKAITVGDTEGIQVDGSFYQHGPRLYSGGYGRSYMNDCSAVSYLLQGTEYQFSEDELDAIAMLFLDGTKYMIQGVALDYACVGRELSRYGALKSQSFKGIVDKLYNNLDMPRRDELKAALDIFDTDIKRPDETKYFPKAPMLCHHFDGIYVGAKFLDNTTYDAEICNLEGELCYNMSYGTHTCIMRDGYEYLDINPIWDYSRVPGTTSRTETDEELLAHRNWWCLPLPNDHSAGGQRGNRAIIYELAEHDGIKAMVSDFAFEGGFVSLGAGIEDTTDKKEVLVTTVDQSFLRGEIVREGNAYLHNGIRYTPLCGTVIEAESKEQVGSWHRNNFPLSADEVKGEVLTLTINHNSGEVSDYAYMISSGENDAPRVRVLRNDTDIQAIQLSDGAIMAVFHKPCELSVDGRVINGEIGTYIE